MAPIPRGQPVNEAAPDTIAQAQGVRVLTWFFAALYVFGGLVLAISAYMAFHEARLALAGSDGRASVTNMRENSYTAVRSNYAPGGQLVRAERRTDYYVTYQFEVDGTPYSFERTVDEDFYKTIEPGDTVPVRYYAPNPEFNDIDRNRARGGVYISMGLALFFLAAGLLFHLVTRSFKAKIGHGVQPEAG